MLKTLKVANLEERLDKIENSLELEDKSVKPVTSDLSSMVRTIKDKTINLS